MILCSALQPKAASAALGSALPHLRSDRSTSEASTCLGFRVSRGGLSPGPKMKKRLRRKLRQVEALGAEKLERSLISYRGLVVTV